MGTGIPWKGRLLDGQFSFAIEQVGHNGIDREGIQFAYVYSNRDKEIEE